MTTNDTIPAAPPALSENNASRPTTTPDALVLLEPKLGLLNRALEEAGLDAEDLENLAVTARIAFDVDNVWAVGASPPGRPEQHIVGIFEGSQADINDSHVPGDIRAYVTPLTAPTPAAKMWTRFVLSRVNPTMAVAVLMNQERFVEELAGEFEALSGVRDEVATQNEELRDVLEKMTLKAGETMTPAVLRCQEIEKMGLDALETEEGDEEDEA
jgi:hypothetical protein